MSGVILREFFFKVKEDWDAFPEDRTWLKESQVRFRDGDKERKFPAVRDK